MRLRIYYRMAPLHVARRSAKNTNGRDKPSHGDLDS